PRRAPVRLRVPGPHAARAAAEDRGATQDPRAPAAAEQQARGGVTASPERRGGRAHGAGAVRVRVPRRAPVRRRATVDDGAAGVHHNDDPRQEALTRQSGARGAALSRPCPEASTQAESGGGFGGAGLVEPTNATGQLAQEIARERRRLLEDALEPA